MLIVLQLSNWNETFSNTSSVTESLVMAAD